MAKCESCGQDHEGFFSDRLLHARKNLLEAEDPTAQGERSHEFVEIFVEELNPIDMMYRENLHDLASQYDEAKRKVQLLQQKLTRAVLDEIEELENDSQKFLNLKSVLAPVNPSNIKSN